MIISFIRLTECYLSYRLSLDILSELFLMLLFTLNTVIVIHTFTKVFIKKHL